MPFYLVWLEGVCRECILKEIEQAIAEEHPELKRDDVFELVQDPAVEKPDCGRRQRQADSCTNASPYRGSRGKQSFARFRTLLISSTSESGSSFPCASHGFPSPRSVAMIR